MKPFDNLLLCGLSLFAIAACSNSETGTGATSTGPVADAAQESQKITSPNIIYILTDDQGWTSVSYREDPDIPESASDYIETPRQAANSNSTIAPTP